MRTIAVLPERWTAIATWPFARRVFERVGDEVRDRAADVAAVAGRAHRRIVFAGRERQFDAARAGERFEFARDLARDRAQVEHVAVGPPVAAFEARDEQQRFGQTLHVVGGDNAAFDDLAIALGQLAVRAGVGLAQASSPSAASGVRRSCESA